MLRSRCLKWMIVHARYEHPRTGLENVFMSCLITHERRASAVHKSMQSTLSLSLFLTPLASMCEDAGNVIRPHQDPEVPCPNTHLKKQIIVTHPMERLGPLTPSAMMDVVCLGYHNKYMKKRPSCRRES